MMFCAPRPISPITVYPPTTEPALGNGVTSDGIEWSQRFSLQRVLSRRRAISIDLEAFGPTEPATYVEEYEAAFRYRQRIWREWLFYEIEPALVFPRERGYDTRPELTFRLELVLGDFD